MPAQQDDKQQAQRKKQERQESKDAISQQVLGILGRPRELFDIQVRPLWGSHYRVNVLIGPDAASVRVANSYFVSVDPEGRIIHSTPEIRKQY